MSQPQKYKVNQAIRALQVRLIHKTENKVVPIREAILLAKAEGKDLIEIVPTANPPVCKIEEFGKFKYELEKSQKADKPPKLKELQLHTNTGEHDLQTKLRQAESFLEENHPVTLKLQFRGRENAHKELGIKRLQEAASKLEMIATTHGTVRVNGKLAMLTLLPKKQKNPQVHPNLQNNLSTTT
jgi:translation initiation factor IF-3